MGEHKHNVHLIDKNRPSTAHAAIMDGAKAQGRWVICEYQAAEKTQDGLIVPDVVKQGLAWVVADVGPKANEAIQGSLQRGDRVVFQGAVDFSLGKRKFAFVDAASIMVVLDRENADKFFADGHAAITSLSGEAS